MKDHHPTDLDERIGMMQAAVKTKKPRKQAVSGRFWAMRTYRGRIKDDHKIDPCQGSGHILAYMFDVLVKCYEAYGFSSREAVSSIVKNNINDNTTAVIFIAMLPTNFFIKIILQIYNRAPTQP